MRAAISTTSRRPAGPAAPRRSGRRPPGRRRARRGARRSAGRRPRCSRRPPRSLEQLRLLVQVRVPVQLQQLPLDLHHLLGPRLAALALLAAGRRRVSSSSAGSTTAWTPERLISSAGEPDLVSERGALRSRSAPAAGRRRRRAPRAPRSGGSAPRAPARPDRRSTPELARRIVRWRPIATLHRPMARWPSSSSAWVTIPTGFVKSTIHASGAPRARRRLGQLEHHRAPSAAPWRSRPARSSPGRSCRTGGQRLVDQAGRLAADPELDEDEVGAVERRVAVAGQYQPARPSPRGRASAGEPADDLEPLRVDVEQDELVDRQRGRPGAAMPSTARACRCCRRRRPRP